MQHYFEKNIQRKIIASFFTLPAQFNPWDYLNKNTVLKHNTGL